MNPRETDREKLEPVLLPQIIKRAIDLFRERGFYVDDSHSMQVQTIEDAAIQALRNYGYPPEVILPILMREASPQTKDNPFNWKLPHICQEDLTYVHLLLASAIIKIEIKRLHPDIAQEDEIRQFEIRAGSELGKSSLELRKIRLFGEKANIRIDVKLPGRS